MTKKMKKLFASLLVTVLLASTISTSVCAETLSGSGYTTEGVWISFDTETGLVTGDFASVGMYYAYGVTKVTIPSTIEGYTVTVVDEWAFSEFKSLTTVIFPDTITTIGYGAFSDCSSLESIEIPSGVTTIEGMTFSMCEILTDVSIPDTVTSIEYGAFRYCYALKSITIPTSVTSMEQIFSSCSGLEIYYEGTEAQWEAIKFHEDGLFIDDGTYTVVFGGDISSDESSSDTSTDTPVVEVKEEMTDGVLEYDLGGIAGVTELTTYTDEVTLVFDEDALASITSALLSANEDLGTWYFDFTITVDVVDVTTLDESIQEIVGDRPVYDFNVWATDTDDNSMQITDFGDGSVTITMDYELAEGESADNLVIYYIDGDQLETIQIDSYDSVNGKITFTTTHFSTYAVGYEEAVADTDTTDTDTTDTDDDDIPETGDTTSVLFMSMIMCLSLAGVVVCKKKIIRQIQNTKVIKPSCS